MATKAQAIDHLVDVLAGSDVTLDSQTVAGRITELADLIEDGTITIGGGGGGVSSWNDLTDKPFYEGSTQLFSESVTTVEADGLCSANLTYSTAITADTLVVTFDGTDYTVSKTDGPAGAIYGEFGESGIDYTNYPFCLMANNGQNVLFTETAGTYAIAASIPSIATTDEFEEAVNAVDIAATPLRLVGGVTTAEEIDAAKAAGRMMYFYRLGGYFFVSALDTDGTNGTFVPESQLYSIAVTDGVFTVTVS